MLQEVSEEFTSSFSGITFLGMSSSNLLILTSPPASGKTYWIENFTKTLEKQVLVLSPLRALANECKSHWGSKVNVMTPEEWLKNKIYPEVVIFDEFHLLFYWGDTFRPLLWETFYEVVLEAKLVVLLTATFSQTMLEEMKGMKFHFDRLFWIDFGNQKLKFSPTKYVMAPGREWLLNQLLCDVS